MKTCSLNKTNVPSQINENCLITLNLSVNSTEIGIYANHYNGCLSYS